MDRFGDNYEAEIIMMLKRIDKVNQRSRVTLVLD
jgi:hypothetical protein